MSDASRDPCDNGQEDLEREIEDRYVAMNGTPMQVPEYLREFMKATYAAREAEKAAQSGRCDGMRPAPDIHEDHKCDDEEA